MEQKKNSLLLNKVLQSLVKKCGCKLFYSLLDKKEEEHLSEKDVEFAFAENGVLCNYLGFHYLSDPKKIPGNSGHESYSAGEYSFTYLYTSEDGYINEHFKDCMFEIKTSCTCDPLKYSCMCFKNEREITIHEKTCERNRLQLTIEENNKASIWP
jgi:hypothetical protein